MRNLTPALLVFGLALPCAAQTPIESSRYVAFKKYWEKSEACEKAEAEKDSLDVETLKIIVERSQAEVEAYIVWDAVEYVNPEVISRRRLAATHFREFLQRKESFQNIYSFCNLGDGLSVEERKENWEEGNISLGVLEEILEEMPGTPAEAVALARRDAADSRESALRARERALQVEGDVIKARGNAARWEGLDETHAELWGRAAAAKAKVLTLYRREAEAEAREAKASERLAEARREAAAAQRKMFDDLEQKPLE